MSEQGPFEITTLKNGTKAVRHRIHGEVMHPMGGPWEEANRLYVEQTRLAERLLERQKTPLRILDVGLGGAANACAALTCARHLASPRRELHLYSLEFDLMPLRLSMADNEGFPFLTPWLPACRDLIANGEYREPGIQWTLQMGDALAAVDSLVPGFDIVFFDPFSPETNPLFWTVEHLSRFRRLCSHDAVLATYSAATPTRVSLLLAGFFVGAGISSGLKSETTIASTSLLRLDKPLDARWLSRWERSSSRAPHGETFTPAHEGLVYGHPQWKAVGVR